MSRHAAREARQQLEQKAWWEIQLELDQYVRIDVNRIPVHRDVANRVRERFHLPPLGIEPEIMTEATMTQRQEGEI